MPLIEYLRQFRIGEYALFDFIASFVGMALLAPILSWLFLKIRIAVPMRNWVILTLPIGIVAHIVVGVITPMTADFLSLNSGWLVKIVTLTCLYFGLKGITKTKK